MKKLVLILCLTTACASNPAPKNVQIIQAADNIVSVLTTLSHAVEASADNKVITIAQAKEVLDIIKATATTLAATPSGQYAIAIMALDQIEIVAPPTLHPYLMTTRTALEVFRAK